ncbi:MAG: Nif3-like dinuclear metal center hexameric protein [Nanobdellota archaeon]
MVSRKEITKFLDEYLEVKEIKDASFNGLQFEGKQDVEKIVFMVDSGIKPFEKAAELKGDMVVVHHGLFWAGSNPSITHFMKKRLDVLYKNNMNLYAAHLPLDKHKVAGNNSVILRILGAEITDEFFEINGTKIGYVGKLSKETNLEKIKDAMDKDLNTESKTLKLGKSAINKIAVCSGGGGLKAFKEALEHDIDLYITGEETDFYMDALDAEVNVIFGGHHATEIVGVRELAKIIEKEFGVETEFVDIPTGL